MTYKELYDDACRKLDDGRVTVGEFEKMIEPLYRDILDIIQCKDCAYSHMTYSGECKYCDMWKEIYDSGESLYLEGDFFCAFGKRRETDG